MEGVNEPTKIHRSGKSHSVFYLSDLNPARISPTNSFGCSQAAGYCVNSVGRLPDEDHVRFCLDDRGKTLAKDRMIFDTQHANGLKMGHFMGPYCNARLCSFQALGERIFCQGFLANLSCQFGISNLGEIDQFPRGEGVAKLTACHG
jgi:hypothetical protein